MRFQKQARTLAWGGVWLPLLAAPLFLATGSCLSVYFVRAEIPCSTLRNTATSYAFSQGTPGDATVSPLLELQAPSLAGP